MTAAPLAHIIQGPLDALLEFGVPLIILGAMWAWSKRAEKDHKEGDDPKQ